MRVIRAPRSPLQQLGRATTRLARCLSSSSDASDLQTRPLRVGVVGLGAIGTILFARLGEVALDAPAPMYIGNLDSTPKPSLAVDALVKPRHLASLFAGSELDGSEHPAVMIHDASAAPSATATRIAFRRLSERLAEATESSSVRIRALAAAGDDAGGSEGDEEMDPSERLDVVLVAVKAYDSAATVRGLQQRHAQLIKDDALVVLLQNGIGEVPTVDDVALDQHQQRRWRYAHGVTYVGGRALSVGNVVVSGVDAATTFIAPVATTNGDSAGEDLATARKIDALGLALTAAGELLGCVRCLLLCASRADELSCALLMPLQGCTGSV